MNYPLLECIPLRTAVASDATSTLDVLVRITPAQAVGGRDRPTLNLGLVIDRSGSMSGQKLDYALRAAIYAVEQLLASDRVSVTVFDDAVEVPVPSVLATDKRRISERIRRIDVGGSTALHAGWVEGSTQVSRHLDPRHLNRVVLLSDGQANVGETNADTIANHVHGLAGHGVSTSTLGIGDDYDEDLLAAMAASGGGNFAHMSNPESLPGFFAAELQGLASTTGRRVTLGVEPRPGVQVLDVLNDFARDGEGRLVLPDLVAGNPLRVVLRLKVTATTSPAELCWFHLEWLAPGHEERLSLSLKLQLLAVPQARLDEYPLDAAVQQEAAILMAARARTEAVRLIDRGEYAAAGECLEAAKVSVQAAPASENTEFEAQSLEKLQQDLASGEVRLTRKQATYQSFNTQRSRKYKP